MYNLGTGLRSTSRPGEGRGEEAKGEESGNGCPLCRMLHHTDNAIASGHCGDRSRREEGDGQWGKYHFGRLKLRRPVARVHRLRRLAPCGRRGWQVVPPPPPE